LPVSEHGADRVLQDRGRMLRSQDMPDGVTDAAGDSRRGEDRRPPLLVEAEDVFGADPEPERDGDDAAGGRSGDEVEVVGDRLPGHLLQLGEDRGGEGSFDAAAVEAQDAEMIHGYLRRY